jgi:dTDP-glucose 4,6-dehydratase
LIDRSDLDYVTGATAPLWERHGRGMRLLITGGTGFFGAWLLSSFVRAVDELGIEAEAVVLTRDPDGFRRRLPEAAGHPAVRPHAGDVRDFAFPEGQFTHVIHAAADASRAKDDPLGALDTLTGGTRRVLECAAHAGGARRFLFTSSGAVYGAQPPDLTHVPEDYAGAPNPLAPGGEYASGKRYAEALTATFCRAHGIEPVVARCFAFLGAYLPLDGPFAAGNFVRDGLAGREIVVNGDGTPFRSYLYGADLAVWLWTLLFAGRPGTAYNVGSDDAVRIGELARLVAERCGVGVRVAGAARPGQPEQRYVPSIGRAREELGLRVGVRLREAVDRTVRSYENRG